MAYFIVPADYGTEIEPVGHCEIKREFLSDNYGVFNTLDDHRSGTILIQGTQVDCQRFIAWVIQQIGSGKTIIDIKQFHRNTRIATGG